MPTDTLLVIGAGGHGRVVMDALLARDGGSQARFVDDDPRLHGTEVLGRPVEASAALHRPPYRFHVAIGANAVRAATIERIESLGRTSFSVVHGAAVVSARAAIADGAFVAAGAIVGPGARIAAGAIINHGAVVDHDCEVGACAHIAPNATLGGAVKVGRRVLVGAGANLLPRVVVGDDAVIGAGAVVLRDVAAGTVVVGAPARTIEGKPN